MTTTPASVTTFTASGLSTGSHGAYVTAVNTSGESVHSVTQTFTLSAAGSSSSSSGFVQRSRTGFTLNGSPYKMFFGSINGASTPSSDVVAQAGNFHLNMIRFTDWIDTNGTVGVADRDATQWGLLDSNIAALRTAGLKCVLDLSGYRNLLKTSGVNPYTYDWTGFLSFVLDRVNTVSGLIYKSDPTIAYVAFAGETDSPGSNSLAPATASVLTAFFSTVSAYWKNNGGQQLCSPGGWLFMDAQGAGIPVDAIAALSTIDFIAIHSYSPTDLAAGIPYLSSRALAAGKPWVNEEFGDALSSGITLAQQAAYFNQRYIADDEWGAAGEGFWNVALTDATAVETNDISSVGATGDAIRARATGATPAGGQSTTIPSAANYAALVAQLNTSLSGYWRLGDYASGGHAADSSGHGLTGAYATTGTASAAGLLMDDSNGAMAVTAAGGGMTVPYNSALDLTTAATINLWVQASSWTTGSDARILQKSTNDGIYQILNSAAGGIAFKLGGLSNVTIPLPSTNTPHMVTVTYDGGGVLAYMDGVLIAASGSTSSINTDTGPLTIGDKPSDNYGGDQFSGTIDEVAIWKRPLSRYEIEGLHAQGSALSIQGGTATDPYTAVTLPALTRSGANVEIGGLTKRLSRIQRLLGGPRRTTTAQDREATRRRQP